jgi:hypothetical protein
MVTVGLHSLYGGREHSDAVSVGLQPQSRHAQNQSRVERCTLVQCVPVAQLDDLVNAYRAVHGHSAASVGRIVREAFGSHVTSP